MQSKVTLDSLVHGALAEQFEVELENVIKNISDPNTSPKAARKLTISITLKPNEQRNVIMTDAQVKATLAPANKVATSLLIDKDSKGKLVVSELGNELPGQVSIEDVEKKDDSKIINMK